MDKITKGSLTIEEIKSIQDEMMKINWLDPTETRVVAETVTRELREELADDQILQKMQVAIETFREGQRIEFVTTKGTKAYVHAPGSDAPRSQLVNKTVQLFTELVSVNPEMELGQLQSGRYGGLAELKRQAEVEFRGRRYSTIWTTLLASVATTDANYWTTAASATSAQKLAALISGFDYVADQNGSDVVAIVGRRSALTFLGDHGAYTNTFPSEGLKTQMDSSKFITSFRDVPVIPIKQYADVFGVSYMTDSNVMILGMDTIKMGIDRPLSVIDGIDKDNLMYSMHMYEKYGVAVINPTRNARLVWA